MILAFVSNYFLLLSLIGYSFFFKKIILNNSSYIQNLDIFFGVFLLFFLSLFFNFFFPIKFLVLPIFFLGLSIFCYLIVKKKFKENLLKYLLIVFFTTFVSFNNGNNVDSPMYHLQVLKWISESKIVFGLANLEIRFGMNSSYHSLLPLLDISLSVFSAKYYVSAIFLALLIYESTRHIIKLNKLEVSQIFIFFSVIYLILYSLIHPFHNGVIFNHLGNPETDIFSMIIYFFLIFVIIRIIKEKDKKLLEVFFILLFLNITSRLSYLPLILLFLFFFNSSYNIFHKQRLFLFLLFFSAVFWFLRSFILSGCIIYPVYQTCLETSWSIDNSVLKSYLDQVSMYTRGMISGNHDNYDFTIQTSQWLKPWLKDYFFTSSLIQISLIILFFSVIYLILIKFYFYKKISFLIFSKFEFKVILIHIILFVFWYMAPEIRYLWGPLIGFPIFLLSYAIYLDFKYKFFFKNIVSYKLVFFFKIIIICLLALKNYKFYDLSNNFVISKKNFNYSNIIKVKTVGRFDIYQSVNRQCADFKEICVNALKSNYFFDIKYRYIFIKSD